MVINFNACKKEDAPQTTSGIKMWVTSADKSSLLKEFTSNLFVESSARYSTILEIDTTQKFQEIDGFGFALTGGSAYLIQNKLTKIERDTLLQNLFSDNGIAVSYLRISVGASDLDDHAFTYNDLPAGQTDEALKNFSIAADKAYLIPLLKDILKINPHIKLMASPWSAPAWMKTNNNLKGGSLKQNYYQAYANYFVNYLKAMEQEGLKIEAITLQNEPENPNNNPSMVMTAEEQALFVKKYLGPAFKAATLTTKIIVFDHNADHPEYPITILNDKEASDFIDGSAFHLYLGQVDALSKVHDAHPSKNLYFTEQWTGAKGEFGGDFNWHIKNLIIGATQNWARTVLEWNLAADANFAPHTDGGCTECRGAVTINNGFTKNVSYYIIGQASKFVKPGSIRIASSPNQDLPNVAFLTPKGEKVLIVLNERSEARNVSIKQGAKYFSVTINPSSAATIVL
jgi:glucosylceramidase